MESGNRDDAGITEGPGTAFIGPYIIYSVLVNGRVVGKPLKLCV